MLKIKCLVLTVLCVALKATEAPVSITVYPSSTDQGYNIQVEMDSPGVVTSPMFYRQSYENNMMYSWRLQTQNATTEVILIYPVYLNTESCCDHITVNYLLQNFSILGRSIQYQGYELPIGIYAEEPFWHAQSDVRLFFQTDSNVRMVGFVLRYIGLDRNMETAQAGHIYEPLFPWIFGQLLLKETNSNEVAFKITASPGERVVVKVVYMDMDRSYGCLNDYLIIYDDDSNSDPRLLLKACRIKSDVTEFQVVSLSNSLQIKFSCTQEVYTVASGNTSICAIINYSTYDQNTDYEQGDIDIDIVDFTPNSTALYGYNSYPDPYLLGMRLNCHHVRFSVDMEWGAHILLQQDHEEFTENIAEIILDKEHQYHGGDWVSTLRYKTPYQPDVVQHSYHYAKNLEAGYHRLFWINFNMRDISMGHGLRPHENGFIWEALAYPINFNYIRVKGHQGSFKLFKGCNKEYMGWQRISVQYMYSHDHEQRHLSGDIHYEYTRTPGWGYHTSWLHTKSHATDVLTLEVTETSMSWSPDCHEERVSIYRGECSTKAMMVAYFCGSEVVGEIYTQTDNLHTVIEFTIDITDAVFNYDYTERHFTIKYHVNDGENALANAIITIISIVVPVIAVIIITSIITVVCCIKKKQRQRRARNVTQNVTRSNYPTHPPPAYHGPQQQGQMSGPTTVNVNIINTPSSAPDKDNLYGNMDDNFFTGVPPPAIYDPPPFPYANPPPPAQLTMGPFGQPRTAHGARVGPQYSTEVGRRH